jgi:hypothetical protein
MIPDTLRDGWSGPRWRWWALLAGLILTGACLLLGLLLATLFNTDAPSLMLLCLMVALVAVALVGAGLLERLSSRMVTGQGLERQPLPQKPDPKPGAGPRPMPPRTAEQERRDRTTIRAGLVVLPLIIAFGFLLYR